MNPPADDAATYEAASGRAALDPRAPVARLARAAPWPVIAITGLAAALRFASLSHVAPNEFYDAAVRSMSLSFGNFLFGAFEPGRLLSIDKPPLDLWLQVISTQALGFNSFALKLPEALGGTLAVPLLYDAVRRVAGRPAALASAAALAFAPASVLTARSDTMDSVMMLLVVAALWFVVRACEPGPAAGRLSSRRALVLAGVALGVAFEVKLLEPLLCLPALGLIYLLGAPPELGVRRQVADLALAGAALVAVGLGWAVVVSLAPGHHPWPVGSSDGTVWNAMFVFNGTGKAQGMPDVHTGGPGIFRLVVSTAWQYDRLFGGVLVAAVVLGGAALLQRLLAGDRSLRSERLPRAFAAGLGLWMVCGITVFDTMGTVHARYLEALAPAPAMVIGIAAAALAGFGPSGQGLRRPNVAITSGALGLICLYSFHFHNASSSWAAISLLLAASGAGLLAAAPGAPLAIGRWLVAGLAVATALAFPAHEALSLVRAGNNDSLGLAVTSQANARALSAFLRPRTGGLRYELAADEPLSLAPLIIRDERPILPLTSFKGEPLVGIDQLAAAVSRGQVRYGLVSAYGCGARQRAFAACTPAARWIRAHGVNVTADAGLTGRERLYRLAPAAPVASG